MHGAIYPLLHTSPDEQNYYGYIEGPNDRPTVVEFEPGILIPPNED
jgi:hypothetical protein